MATKIDILASSATSGQLPSQAGSSQNSSKQQSLVSSSTTNDAVNVQIDLTEKVQKSLKSAHEEMKKAQEERDQKAQEIREQNFGATHVQFMPAEDPGDVRFRIVEVESGEVKLEYPPEYVAQKLESSQAATTVVANKIEEDV